MTNNFINSLIDTHSFPVGNYPIGFSEDTLFKVIEDDVGARYLYSKRLVETPFTLKTKLWEGCPYNFAAKTLGDVVAYILRPRRRMYYNSGSHFAWNVKAYPNVNGTDETSRDKTLDHVWERYLENTPRGRIVREIAYENAQEYYRNDWSSYPGQDQGDWTFTFGGRSGGWIMLERWRGYPFAPDDNLYDFVAELTRDHLLYDDMNLERFYIGMVCADRDFTQENASEEVSVFYGDAREQWEGERKESANNLTEAMLRAYHTTCVEWGLDAKENDESFTRELRELVVKYRGEQSV